MPRAARVSIVALVLVALAGCAGTRSGGMGMLPDSQPLVRLVVTEDRDVVARECRGALALGRIVGCQTSGVAQLPGGQLVRTVRIVRLTDALPSPMAFEIDLHELCHAIAAVQDLADPCHGGGDGRITSRAREPDAAGGR